MKKINCVLLVNEDTIDNYVNEGLIRKMNIADSVAITSSVPDAMSFLREYTSSDNRSPEVIILDLYGSRIDNIQFIETFREIFCENCKYVKILILTSTESSPEISELRSRGISEFIVKPLSAEKLLPFLNGSYNKISF